MHVIKTNLNDVNAQINKRFTKRNKREKSSFKLLGTCKNKGCILNDKNKPGSI